MPKRRVKQISWEVESERISVTPSIRRGIEKSRITRATAALLVWKVAATQEDIFYAVADAAFGAYDLAQFALAEEIAQIAIQVDQSFEDNWNYGNALFAGHTVLGLLALRQGNAMQAVKALHSSADNQGSPQLRSFGPTMRLAKELLEQGKSDDVIVFLHQCLSFWKLGDAWVEVWEKKIRRGQMPNFYMNLR